MNRIKIFFLLFVMVILSVSCYEDKGNYDYHPINEVSISGIHQEYEIERWDTLKIPVTLKNSLDQNRELVYAWYLDKKKIAETRDLNYVISEKAKKYAARFEVTDPANDSVRFFQDFEVAVRTMYATGLMLLSECGEHPEISFYNTQTNPARKIVHDMFRLENNKLLNGKALGIEQSSRYSYGGVIFIHTSASSHQLDPVLCKEMVVFDENSFTEPNPVYDMIYCRFEDAIEKFGTAIGKDGRIYPKQSRQNRFMSASLKPVYVEGKQERIDYALSPMALTTRNAVLTYDNISGRFLYFYNSYDIPSYDENQYDMVRMSKTHIGLPWLGWGFNMNGGSYGYSSLFYDAETNEAALVRAHSHTGNIRGQDSLVILKDHHLSPDSRMVISPATNRLYYSDGGHKLYVLNLSDPEFKFASLDFECGIPDNCRITMLKLAANNLDLFVGVVSDRQEKYNGDVYRINAKDGTVVDYLKGFGGKPVDMIEKVAVDDYDVEE